MFAPTFKASSATPGNVANETRNQKFEKNIIFLRIINLQTKNVNINVLAFFPFFSDVHAFNHTTTIIHRVNMCTNE